MRQLRALLSTQRWDILIAEARGWLVVDGPTLLAGRLAPDEAEGVIHEFLAELWPRSARFWPAAIGPQANALAVRAYVRRAFLRFALRRLDLSVGEAGALRRQTCRLVADAPAALLSRHPLADGRAYGLPGWSRRPLFTGPWSPVLDPVRGAHSPYTRRRRHHGAWTWHADDILDGCRRLLGVCRRLVRALHLARGLLDSNWFHIVGLFDPVPLDELDASAAARSPLVTPLFDELDAFVDELPDGLRDALWCLINRYEQVSCTRWATSTVARRWRVSSQTIYNRRREVEQALRCFLEDLEPTDRLLAIDHLRARFAAMTSGSTGPIPPTSHAEESSGAAA